MSLLPRHAVVTAIGVVTVVSLAACHRAATTGAAGGGGGTMARAATPAAVTPANVALGDSLFNTGNCQRCHGKGGIGAVNAPALDGKKWLQLTTGSFEEIVAVITNGVPATAIKDPSHKFRMNPRGGPMNLTDAQVQAVAAYVYTLSHK